MKALVTGGGGFLGGAVARLLRARGDEVRSFSRGKYESLAALGVEQLQGDLADAEAVDRAVAGVDAVIHVGAKAGVWGAYEDYHATNVVGTRNVVEACRRHGVARLVYTSSPSVIFDGSDMEGVDESVPYPEHYEAHYPRTKAEAERFVLSSNDSALATVALRPHLIWGPGDNHLVPRILAKGRAGELRQIGKEQKLIDWVYIDDAARSHLLALDRLAPGAEIAGKAYFISQGMPVPTWDLVNRILEAGGVEPVTRVVPAKVAQVAGGLFELTHRLLGRGGEPRMTRFVARELSTAHWFDITAARRDLGYTPVTTLDEALARLGQWLRNEGTGARHAA